MSCGAFFFVREVLTLFTLRPDSLAAAHPPLPAVVGGTAWGERAPGGSSHVVEKTSATGVGLALAPATGTSQGLKPQVVCCNRYNTFKLGFWVCGRSSVRSFLERTVF